MSNGILDIDFRYNGDGELEILEDSIHPSDYPDRSDGSSGWRLDMVIKINGDGDLEVEDTTPYEQWDADGYLGDNWAGLNRDNGEDPSWKFIVLERIVSENSEETKLIGLYGVENANSIPALRHNGVYEVPGNGLYHYQKLIIPYNSSNLINPDKLCYNHTIHKICQYDENNVVKSWSVSFGSGDTASLGDPSDFDEIFNLVVDRQYNSCFYYSRDTFSMYDIVECYVMKEQARLKEMLRNGCSGTCTSGSNDDYALDLLLSAMIVIDDLIKKGNYFEAQRIIDSLNTCNNLCKDVKNKLKGCGCGTN